MKVIHPAVQAPICAVCNKTVERFEWDYSINDDTRTYRAYCHGATQRVMLTSMEIMMSRVELGLAFDFARLK